MKMTLALLATLTGMSVAASRKQRTAVIKQAYYSNLFAFTSDVSRKVFETRIELVRCEIFRYISSEYALGD
jgi:hypothetical protein